MAVNGAGMRVEGTTVASAAAKHGGAYRRRVGIAGLVAAILIAALITGVAMRDRQASHPTATAIPRAVTSQQARFLENNTTNLPNAVAAESAPVVVTSSQQRFLEANTTTLPDAAAVSATSPITSSQQRFWEVNTMLPEGPSYPNAEALTPLPGHPR
jgi:predicted lipid-binding transport protein (Tim44 family)